MEQQMPCIMCPSMLLIGENAQCRSKEADTKLLQPMTSTTVRPSVSSEGRYMHCQRFYVEVSRGAGTTCDVVSLGLAGRRGRRTSVQQSSDLKTSDWHKFSSSFSKRCKQLIIPLKAFMSGGGHASFSNERKETTKQVSQAVLANVFNYSCVWRRTGTEEEL